MTKINELREGENGFTLVELLVSMGLMIVVLLGVLMSLDVFTSNAAHQTQITDANDQVRRTMDRTVNDLRGASAILRADSGDLVYAVPELLGHRVVRICTASGELYGSSTSTTVTPTVPAAACSAGTKLATLKSTANTGFTYDGATSSTKPELVKNVGLVFSLAATAGGKAGSSTLRASAARRSAGALLTTDDDVDARCNAGGALLSLSASIPGGIGPFTVVYEDDGGVEIGTPVTGGVQIPRGITRIVARITDALGVTNTIERDVECGTEP